MGTVQQDSRFRGNERVNKQEVGAICVRRAASGPHGRCGSSWPVRLGLTSRRHNRSSSVSRRSELSLL
jgi:hypothetical protein